ncbi:MAG: sodium:solute symporter family protein [Ignavibacteriaceae bacterium]|nr:sodium:solute symporter family protein [Ignavibacteriaceae bacterium]
MITFSAADIIIIVVFLLGTTLLGMYSSRNQGKSKRSYLLAGGKVGLVLFVMTNVSTWYGGILGVGEYSFRYGIASWFTQGLPYYIFAALFALFMTERIKNKSYYSIPEAIKSVYGEGASRIASVLIFILVTPAPYLLMVAYILKLAFDIPLLYGLILAFLLSVAYLLKGGYKSDLITDAVFFVIMFLGFTFFLYILASKYGGIQFLAQNLPVAHLTLTGGLPYTVVIVWWLVSLWTFADPGFYQRTTAAGSIKIARRGILISIFFWFLFDLLTNGVGLYSRAIMPELSEPVLAFPLLAEQELKSGYKAFFFIALLATILSTLNSFLFLSGLTFGNDIAGVREENDDNSRTIFRVRAGILVSGIISIILALTIPSVIEIWYTIGSICIPGIILLVISSYFPAIRVTPGAAYTELIGGPFVSLIWYFAKENVLTDSPAAIIEPMLAGLGFTVLVHLYNMRKERARIIK